MSAALRLAERGYKVTIYEQNDFVGGKFRAVEWKDTKAFHEHSYHMFLNWYHKFSEIAETIGVRKEFVPLQRVKFLRAGDFPKMTQLVNFGRSECDPAKPAFGRAVDFGYVSLHVLRRRSAGQANDAGSI